MGDVNRSSTFATSPKLIHIDKQRMIAYRNILGNKQPGVIYLPGYNSSMETSKALALEEFCQKNGFSYVRFDYEGTGESSGDFSKQTIGRWKENVLTVLATLTHGPQILVGSSMGAWLALLVALSKPERVHSIVGISSAVNFIRDLQERPDANLQKESDGGIQVSGPFGNFLFSNFLIEESSIHFIDLKSTIPITCPIRLIHGMKDDVIPHENSILLCKALSSTDVELTFRKNGDHRMAEADDVNLLIKAVQSLITK